MGFPLLRQEKVIEKANLDQLRVFLPPLIIIFLQTVIPKMWV